MNSSPDLFAALRAVIESASHADLPAIIGDLAELQAVAYARALSSPPAAAPLGDSERLRRIEQTLSDMRRPDAEAMLTEQEAARMRRKTVHALRKERARSAGPRWVRDGRRVLYPKTELEAWLAEREHETRDSHQKPRFPRAIDG